MINDNILKRGDVFLIQQDAVGQAQHTLSLDGLVVLARQMGALSVSRATMDERDQERKSGRSSK
jgi:hypothetical protein